MSPKIGINGRDCSVLPYVSQGKKKMKYFTQLLITLVDDFFATQDDEDLMKG